MSRAQFEILLEGKPRSLPDQRQVAFEAAQYLKSKNAHSVAVRDLRTNTDAEVGDISNSHEEKMMIAVSERGKRKKADARPIARE